MMSRRAVAAAFLIVASSLFVGVGAGAQGSGEFTRAERERLLAGELVQRPRRFGRTPGIQYVGGTSFQRIAAPQERVWAIVEDVAQYQYLLPAVDEVRVVGRREGQPVVYMRHRYGPVTGSYHLVMRADRDAHTVRFELDRSRPGDVDALRAFIQVDSFRGDESIVTWGCRGGSRNMFLVNVFRPVMDDWALVVPTCLRTRVGGGSHCP